MNATFTISPDDLATVLGVTNPEALMPAHNVVFVATTNKAQFALVAMNDTTIRMRHADGQAFDCAIPVQLVAYAVENDLAITVGNGKASIVVDGARVAMPLVDIPVPDVEQLRSRDAFVGTQTDRNFERFLSIRENSRHGYKTVSVGGDGGMASTMAKDGVSIGIQRMREAIEHMAGTLYFYINRAANRIMVMDERRQYVVVHA